MNDLSEELLDELTAYALDALDADERARVEAMLGARPELRPLVRELQQTAALVPYGLAPAEPATDLRERTLAYATGRSVPKRPNVPVRAPRNWLSALLGGAAVAASVAAALAWAQLGTARNEVAEANRVIATLQAAPQATLVQAQALVPLAGPGGRGTALRNANGDVTVTVQLPPLAAGRSYVLWQVGSGGPVNTGVVALNQTGYGSATLAANTVQPGVVLAVTDEAQANVAAPTTPILLASEPLPPG